MIPVSDIWDQAKKLSGNCTEAVIYRNINRAVELLANKSDWDPLTGFLDVSCEDTLVSLPPEIETPLTVSYGNYPALGRDKLFRFHLNGPGDRDLPAVWRWWQDGGEAVTFRDFCAPTYLTAVAINEDDEDKTIWVYGFDINNRVVRSEVDGVMVDGFPFTIKSTFTQDLTTPIFSRITRVRKGETVGPIQLWTVNGTALDTLIAEYAHDVTEPIFRRIRVDRADLPLVRIHYRKRATKLKSLTDLIPLHSSESVVMMVRALRYYDENEFAIAMSCEATAVRWLEEEQRSRNPEIMMPIQVAAPLMCDDDIS